MSSLRARFTSMTDSVKDSVKANVTAESTASTVSSQLGGFGLHYTAAAAIGHHLPSVMEGLNWASDNWIGAHAFAGRLAVQTLNTLNTVRSNTEYNAKVIAKSFAQHLAADVIAAEIVDVAYKGINMLAGRDVADIHMAERVLVSTMATAPTANAVRAAGRFVGEQAPKICGLFSKKQPVVNSNGYENLPNEAGLEPKSTAPKMGMMGSSEV